MNNKGFSLIEIVLSLFLLALVVVCLLPIFGQAVSYFSIAKDKTEMIYIGEMIFERLKSKDDYAKDLLNTLSSQNKTNFIDLDEEILDRFQCVVENIGTDEYIWQIKVTVTSKKNKGKESYEEFKGSIWR